MHQRALKLHVIKFDPKYNDLREDQLKVLIDMMVNRINSVVNDHGFSRNTLTLVMEHIEIDLWSDNNGIADSFYRQEALDIDEIFNDIENDKGYIATINGLGRLNPKSCKIKTITKNQIFLEVVV